MFGRRQYKGGNYKCSVGKSMEFHIENRTNAQSVIEIEISWDFCLLCRLSKVVKIEICNFQLFLEYFRIWHRNYGLKSRNFLEKYFFPRINVKSVQISLNQILNNVH